ncbi:hypothetical protein, partial [Natronobacillus azotifigens]
TYKVKIGIQKKNQNGLNLQKRKLVEHQSAQQTFFLIHSTKTGRCQAPILSEALLDKQQKE